MLKVPSNDFAHACYIPILPSVNYATRGPDRTDSGLYAHKWLVFYHRPGLMYAEDILAAVLPAVQSQVWLRWLNLTQQ